MNMIQALEEQQYSEAARYDRFDGFDRGDDCRDEPERDQGSECIGRVRTEWAGKVEVFRDWCEGDEFFRVVVSFPDGHATTYDDFPAGRDSALGCARWWRDGCPA